LGLECFWWSYLLHLAWIVLSYLSLLRLYGYRSPTDPNCPYVLLLPVSANAIQL
jgi:hypothetical protein